MRKEPVPNNDAYMAPESVEYGESQQKIIKSNSSIEQREEPRMYEEEKMEFKEYYQPEEEKMNRCGSCKKYITEHDEESQNVVVPECFHFFHRDCLKVLAKKQYMKDMKASCNV